MLKTLRALSEICVNRFAAVGASDLPGLLNNCMKQLVLCWFLCAATIVDAEVLEHDHLTDTVPTVVVPKEPYIPPVDVRIELAQLNPQYRLEQQLDLAQIELDGALIQDYRENARKNNPFYGLTIKEPLEPRHISMFVLMNLLDVYTTMEGSSYPCVVEINPLLPAKPSLEELLLLKSLLGWIILDQNLDGTIDAGLDVVEANTWITGIAVANNLDVINRAIRTCPR